MILIYIINLFFKPYKFCEKQTINKIARTHLNHNLLASNLKTLNTLNKIEKSYKEILEMLNK